MCSRSCERWRGSHEVARSLPVRVDARGAAVGQRPADVAARIAPIDHIDLGDVFYDRNCGVFVALAAAWTPEQVRAVVHDEDPKVRAVAIVVPLGERAGAMDARVGRGTHSEPFVKGPLCADVDGFSLHAAVRVEARDRNSSGFSVIQARAGVRSGNR